MRTRRVAMLASKFRPSAGPSTGTDQRVSSIASEIRELRPAHVGETPAAIGPDKTRRALLLLTEMARHQVSVREYREARQSIADATSLLEQVQDSGTIALVSLHLGEALLTLDLPHYARVHFARSESVYRQLGDRRWETRARVGLGRALLALDEPVGQGVLEQMRDVCIELGDHRLLAHIDAALEERAEGTTRAGFARPVTLPPPQDE